MTKEDDAQMLEAMRKRTVAEPQNAEAWRDLVSFILNTREGMNACWKGSTLTYPISRSSRF